MFSSAFYYILTLSLIIPFINAQTSTSTFNGDGYSGYSLTEEGDDSSAVYATNSTPPGTNVTVTSPEPDVFLNASVHVGEIDLTVTNLTAKINLEAQVLSLLTFNAGVTASIDRVKLLIQDVNAEIFLEARLSNLLLMISDVLDSLDLNPVLATLGQDVTSIVNTTVGGLTGSGSGSSSTVSARSYNLEHNILYSINDYSGHTHTNRILAQNGSIVDQSLDNDGHIYGEKIVGYFSKDMMFTGYNISIATGGVAEREIEYIYAPFAGLEVVSAIYTNAAGGVVATQVLSEATGGGGSTISANS